MYMHVYMKHLTKCDTAGVAKLLLDYGANINTHSNEFKESALTLACYKGHLEMVKYLLNAGTFQLLTSSCIHTVVTNPFFCTSLKLIA